MTAPEVAAVVLAVTELFRSLIARVASVVPLSALGVTWGPCGCLAALTALSQQHQPAVPDDRGDRHVLGVDHDLGPRPPRAVRELTEEVLAVRPLGPCHEVGGLVQLPSAGW